MADATLTGSSADATLTGSSADATLAEAALMPALAEGVTLHAEGGDPAGRPGAEGAGRRPDAEDGALEIRGRFARLRIRRPDAGVRVAVEALAKGPVAESSLARIAGESAVLLFYYLESADDLGLLRWSVVCGQDPLACSNPTSPHFSRRRTLVAPDTPYQLSRFAYCRADGDRTVIESPLAHAVVTVHDRRVAALFFELGRPVAAREAATRVGLGLAAVRALIALLADADMAAPAQSAAAAPALEPPALRPWEFHDLLFHARSRGLRHGRDFGGTYRFAGRIPPLPAVKPAMSGETIDLPRPDIEALRREDLPFTEVLERRRSIRRRLGGQVTARQLGELLFRAARVRGVILGEHGELSERPYPGAGAQYELEIYPVVSACAGLAPGLYHYDPLGHRLEALSAAPAHVGALLEGSRMAERPDVLLVIAARFARIAWKYESIAYALILKDTGVLLQTIYLVAAAMALAPCAIGHGDPDMFARATGIDAHEESSVGEIALYGGASGRD